MTIEYSIIGPVYNESENLEEYVSRCVSAFKGTNISFEIILIDDGSNDDTDQVLKKLLKKNDTYLKVYSHRKNLGLTPALETGFHYSKGKKIIWISTDLESYPDEDIKIMIDGFNEGVDVVLGVRKGRNDGKNFSSIIYNFIINSLFGLSLKDMNWIKGFKRECLDVLELRGDWHRFIVVMLHDKGFKIVEKEVNWYSRKYGLSKFGFSRFPKSVIDALSIWFLMKFGKKPMRIFATIGILFGLVGIILHLYLLIIFLNSGTQMRPIFYSALVLELFSFQFILFGFMAEMNERIRSEIKILSQEKKIGQINNSYELKK